VLQQQQQQQLTALKLVPQAGNFAGVKCASQDTQKVARF